MTRGIRELERLAIRALEGVGQRVESEISCEGEGSNEFGGSDEGVCGWVGIISASEVTVVRSDD